MPMLLRRQQLDKLAQQQQAYPPWRVTVYNLRTGAVDFTYYTCGKCSLKEKDCPTMRPERRDQHVPTGATCAYCNHDARAWTP